MKKINSSLKTNCQLIVICVIAVLNLCNLPTLSAQNIGINNAGATPDPSAMLDIVSTSKGLLIPRVALTATNNASPLTTPATSLVVYNTATASTGSTAVYPGYYYWNGTQWLAFGGTGSLNWSLFGNAGTSSGSNFLGTTDNVSLRFRTNNTQKMIIDSMGYVGIGITLPQVPLHVMGSITAPSNTGTPNGSLILGGTGTGIQMAMGIEADSGINQYGWIQPRYTNNSNNYNLVLNPNGGNVGIGTTIPAFTLDVQGHVNAQVNTTVNRIGYFLTTSTGYAWIASGGGHNNGIAFYTNSSAGGPANAKMFIDNTGNVGIGTTPLFTLDVNGSANCISNTWTSDIRKKKNIETLDLNGLDIISKLRPVTFEWKEVKDDGMKGTQMGFIAQELEKVLPTIVVTANDSLQSKAVKYNEMLPILVKAIQEQQIQIQTLQTENENLKALQAEIEKIKLQLGMEAKK